MPFSIRRFINGQLAAQVTIDSMEFNVPMDDSIFKMTGK